MTALFQLGLAAILIFVEVKIMLTDVYKIPSEGSLAIVAAILTTAVLGSFYVVSREGRRSW